ncbi:hypothetical protein H0H93_012294 [Arthromyces matolae]|nr:hypothetical protein H0H93_012294 [Arthromyces matolae]
MAKVKTSAFQRLLSASRDKDKRRFRTPWRTRTRNKVQKATGAEKAKKKLERLTAKRTYQEALRDCHSEIAHMAEKLRQRFGKHSVDYYLQELMQTSRVNKKYKESGHWNAFVSQEAKRINDNRKDGEPRLKANKLMPEISAAWAKMSKEERIESTKDTLAELRERREMRNIGTHNVPISAFHDTRSTLTTIADEIQKLHERTKLEVLLIAVRSSREHYTRPFVLTTSDRVNDFMQLTLRETPDDFAMRFEGYCLSGVQGITRNYVQELSNKRKTISSLITIKLKEAASGTIARMNYQNFASITERFSLVIKGWPLKTFCPPSDISSRTELDILLNAWTNGTAYFYKMSRTEYNEWLENRDRSGELSITGRSNLPSASINVGANGSSVDTGSMETPSATVDTDADAEVTGHSTTHNPSSSPALSLTEAAATPLTTNFVNLVQTSDGIVVQATKKARKPRKDKGQPRKKRRTENDEPATA